MIQSKLLGVMFIIIAILASYFATFKYGRHVEFLKQENVRKEAIIKSNKENDNLKLLLQVERQNAEDALNVLLDRKPNRVQVPTCASQTNPASGIEQTIEANRILSEETGRILSEDRQRTQGIVGEAEQELIELRVIKDWASAIR